MNEQTDILQLALENVAEVDHDTDAFSSKDIAQLQIGIAQAVELRRIATALEAIAGSLKSVISEFFADVVHVKAVPNGDD